MFENKGGLIKALAYVVLIICGIGVLVAAISVGKTTGRYYHDFNFWTFLAVLVGGGISVYISSLYLYAFGNIEEKTDSLNSI